MPETVPGRYPLPPDRSRVRGTPTTLLGTCAGAGRRLTSLGIERFAAGRGPVRESWVGRPDPGAQANLLLKRGRAVNKAQADQGGRALRALFCETGLTFVSTASPEPEALGRGRPFCAARARHLTALPGSVSEAYQFVDPILAIAAKAQDRGAGCWGEGLCIARPLPLLPISAAWNGDKKVEGRTKMAAKLLALRRGRKQKRACFAAHASKLTWA